MQSTEEPRDELSLGEILQELYRWKWQVLGVTLLVGLVTAGITLTMPNTYQASAALLVREPERPITSSESTLSIETALSAETLRSLAESTEVTWKLFDALWQKQALAEWTKKGAPERNDAFKSFQECLITGLKKQESRGAGGAIAILPLLVLTAKATNPQEAEVIANEWATLVVNKSTEIYTEGVKALDQFTTDIYTRSNTALMESEKALTAKTVESELSLKKARLATVRGKATGFEREVFDLDADIKLNEVMIAEGRRRIDGQQRDGEWIGTVAEEAFKTKKNPFEKETLSAQAQKTLDLARAYVRQTEALRVYKKQHDPLSKKTKLAQHQTNLTRVLNDKAKVDDSLPALEAKLSVFTEQLKSIPEKLTLDKAITDDALWTAYLDNKLPKGSSLLPLKTEVPNTVYQSTKEQIITLSGDISDKRGSSEQLGKSVDATMTASSGLENELDEVQKEIERQEKELDATKTTLGLFHDDYLAEVSRVEDLTLQQVRKQEEKRTKEQLLEATKQQALDLEKDTLVSENELDVLKREIEKTKGVRAALATKAEEVALLQVSAEQASRTGTAILYNAQANPQKVGPARAKMVLASMVIALVACGCLISAAKTVRLAG